MSNQKGPPPIPVREIHHTNRLDTDDVNPLIRQSTEPLQNLDGNYIVLQQKKGQLHRQGPGFQLPMGERMFNGIANYYEVSKKSYPFRIRYHNLPSEQTTMNFNVEVEFSLAVVDPVKIVENSITSLLDCVRHLKREVVRIASKHNVRNTREAQLELQGQLDDFQCEPFLRWTCHLVTIAPDEQALRKLREIEEKGLDMALLAVQADKDLAKKTGQSVTDKIVQVRVDSIEEHQIAKMAPLDQLFQDKE